MNASIAPAPKGDGAVQHRLAPPHSPEGEAERGAGIPLWGIALVAAAVFLTFSVVMATLPRDGLAAHTVPDDAFYYFTIARRFGESRWPTFDGVHTTTGFHPLWLFVLVPFA